MQTTHASALILKTDKFGDHDAIVQLFTPEHGVLRGVVKAGLTSKRRADLQPGNLVQASLRARLPEHMASVSLECQHSFAARVMADPLKLAAVGSMMSLLSVTLAERDPHPDLYAATVSFLQHVAAGTDRLIWLSEYVRLELKLLEEAGFGLDLARCAATGTSHNLAYVSPKSARAVSADAGAPYAAKLLPLPAFMQDRGEFPEAADAIRQGMELTGYFLERQLLPALHRDMPVLRAHFLQVLARQ